MLIAPRATGALRFFPVPRASTVALLCWPPSSVPYISRRFVHQDERVEKRASRRRYSATNTRGRIGQAKRLVDLMKRKGKSEAMEFYQNLLPRDKLDVMRLLHMRRKERRSNRATSQLTRYYSVPFERKYFFREEDVTEQSTLGRGPGGQATNRRMQTALLKHAPSGLIVKFSRFPSLWLNRRAARDLLNLRLEEYLLGPASRLGRARLARARRKRRRQRTLDYLSKKGARLRSKEADGDHWLAFLEGRSSLPSEALREMGVDPSVTAPMTVAMFFGSECHRWWPKVKRATESVAKDGGGAGTRRYLGPECAVPLLLRYLFPAAYASCSPAEQAQLEMCRGCAVALSNVATAFTCFCELFGLQVRRLSASDGNGETRVMLRKDGLNWVEYRGRLANDQVLSQVARICWPHVYLSLRELGMLAEARAVVIFFKTAEKGPTAGSSAPWAAEALRLLTTVIRENKSLLAKELTKV